MNIHIKCVEPYGFFNALVKYSTTIVGNSTLLEFWAPRYHSKCICKYIAEGLFRIVEAVCIVEIDIALDVQQLLQGERHSTTS